MTDFASALASTEKELRRIRTMSDHLDELTAKFRDIRGEGYSEDELVCVTVDQRGGVVASRFAPAVAEVDAGRLGADFMEALRAADSDRMAQIHQAQQDAGITHVEDDQTFLNAADDAVNQLFAQIG